MMVAINHENLKVRMDRERDAVVLTPLAQRLGSEGFGALVRQVVGALSRGPERIILDFVHVRRFSFAACAFLVQMKHLADRAGCELAVRNRPSRLREEMALYHIDEMIEGDTHVGT
ncbi:MAG: STAS domain-containing protein [Planctomycetes bacterium]|nr:STAS domain-containing protein [Planctomycetota bacterium]